MVAFVGTKLSSKGQVVIPQEVRDAMGLKPGAKFVVMQVGDDVLLKTVRVADVANFRAMARRVQAAARKAGITKADIEQAIRDVRAERRKQAT
jgi:antitoxin PrlF